MLNAIYNYFRKDNLVLFRDGINIMKLPDVLNKIILGYYGKTYITQNNILWNDFLDILSFVEYVSKIELFNDELYILYKQCFYGEDNLSRNIHVFDKLTYELKHDILYTNEIGNIICNEPIPFFTDNIHTIYSKQCDKIFSFNIEKQVIVNNKNEYIIPNFQISNVIDICATEDELFISSGNKIIVVSHTCQFIREWMIPNSNILNIAIRYDDVFCVVKSGWITKIVVYDKYGNFRNIFIESYQYDMCKVSFIENLLFINNGDNFCIYELKYP